MDTSFRDGFQSVYGARVLMEDFFPAVEAAKEAGKLRLEGKDYVVQDGDIMHFRFNVWEIFYFYGLHLRGYFRQSKIRHFQKV